MTRDALYFSPVTAQPSLSITYLLKGAELDMSHGPIIIIQVGYGIACTITPLQHLFLRVLDS